MAGPYDIFVNIWQSNNFASSTQGELPRDNGHARIFSMGALGVLDGVYYSPAREPLEYLGWQADGTFPFTVGHILAFCRDYYLPERLASGRNILIVQNAQGGTGFSSTRANSWRSKYSDNGLGGGMHERAVSRVNAAMAAHPGSVIKACFAQGGEEDSFWVSPVDVDGNTTSYYTNLGASGVYESFKDFTVAEVADLRARWTGGANVPFLFGQMAPAIETHHGYKPGSMVAIEDMADFVPNSISIPSTGLTTNVLPEFTHYDAKSQRGDVTQTNPLSKRYWTGYQELEDEGDASASWNWQRMGPGAGGWVTGVRMHADGTFVARTDTNGAYIYNAGTGLWEQMVRNSRLPPTLQTPTGEWCGHPTYDLHIAPSNSSVFYMSYGYGWFLKSTNKGQSWTLTGLARNEALNGNDNTRQWSPKLAIDPINADVVYLSNRNLGLSYTRDGGTTWATAAGVPATATADADIYVVVDPSSTTTNGRKDKVYVYSGTSLYVTSNAGSTTPTWAAIAGSPSGCIGLEIASDGTVYIIDGLTVGLKRYRAGAWANLTPAGDGFSAVAAHPTDATKVFALNGADVYYTADANAATPTWSRSASFTVSSPDIPWLAYAARGNFQTGDACWDTQVANRIWVGDGLGIWRLDTLPPTASNWVSNSLGVEQICTLGIICPGSNPILHVMDRAVFRVTNPAVLPSIYGPDNKDFIDYGYSCDWASSNPAFIGLGFSANVGGAPFRDPTGRYSGENFAASSTDEGVTWTLRGKIPSRTDSNPSGTPPIGGTGWGGGMACATPSNWIIAQMHSGGLIGTTDGGLTWAQINLTAFNIPLAVPDGSVDAGWGGNNSSFPRRRVAAADRVHHENGGTFYAWNMGFPAGDDSKAGIFRSKTGPFGTWEKIYSGNAYYWCGYNAGIKSVPGKAGHLFHFFGPEGNVGDPVGGAGLYYTRNAYTATPGSPLTWTLVSVPSPFMEVADVGFGAPATGKDYPTIFISAIQDGTWGVFMGSGTDAQWAANTVPWVRICTLEQIDAWSGGLQTICGNMARYGEVYGGGGGNGHVYATTFDTPPVLSTYFRPYRQGGRL